MAVGPEGAALSVSRIDIYVGKLSLTVSPACNFRRLQYAEPSISIFGAVPRQHTGDHEGGDPKGVSRFFVW